MNVWPVATITAALVFGLTSAALTDEPKQPSLRAGAATSNITPPLGSKLLGSFDPPASKHVHDELHARCLVLDDGQKRLALVVCDLIELHAIVSQETRRLIAESAGIPPEHVLISATHTHSAPSALGVRPGWTITREWEGYQIKADVAFRDVVPDEYVGVFFSGGRAPEYIRDDEDLIRMTRWFFEHNRPIASVCHGVEIPARAGCVKGRRMATVPKCRFDLEVCGGTFVNEPCVVDGNLVSGRTYHDHGHYMRAWMKLLAAQRQRLLESESLHKVRA